MASPDDAPRADTAGATTERTTTSEAGDWTGPAFGRWLPAPGTVLPVSEYQFGLTDLVAFAEHRESLPPGLRGVVDHWRPVDVDWRTVPFALAFHGTNVLRADYDPAAVVSQVADATGWSEAGEHRRYTLLHSSEETKAVAVGDEAIVVSEAVGDRTALETARGVVDTAAGRVATYPGERSAIDAVMDEFEPTGFTNQWLPVAAFENSPRDEPRFDNQAGVGRWGRFGNGATDLKLVVAFESASAASSEAVRSFVESHRDEGEQFAPWRNLGIRQNGRLVVVDGTVSR